MSIEKKSFLKPLLKAIIFLFTVNFIQLKLILDRLLLWGSIARCTVGSRQAKHKSYRESMEEDDIVMR